MPNASSLQAFHARRPAGGVGVTRFAIRLAATAAVGLALTLGAAAHGAEPARGAVLQLGLFAKEGEAWWAWQTLQRRKPDVAAELKAAVVPLDPGRRGDGVALRASTAAGVDGNRLCRRLVGAGFGCLVIEQAPAPAPVRVEAEQPAPAIPAVPVTIPPLPAIKPVLIAGIPTAAPVAPPAPAPLPAPVAAVAGPAQEAAAAPVVAPVVMEGMKTVTVALASPTPPAPAPAAAPAHPAASGLRFAPFAPAPAATRPAGAPTHSGMPGHDGVFLYNDEDARTMHEIEGKARIRGRLGAIIPDTKIDIAPAVLKRENWNLCALTFDDGPHRTVTRQILEILDREKIHATYFPVGRVAAHYGDIIRDWVASGHEIGNHSLTHADLRSLPAEAQRFEIAEANRILRTMGANPVLFRPPYGRYTLDLLAIARDEHMAPVLWNVDTRDWQVRDPDKIVQHVKTAAGTGSVLLMHSTYPSTASALPRVIAELRAKGCQFVTLSEWIERMRNLAAPMMVNAADPVVSAGAPVATAPH